MIVFFAIIIVMFNWLQYKMYKTFLNPFTLISLVYLFLIIINNYFAVNWYGFFKVKEITMLYLLYFLFLVFLIGTLFYIFSKKSKTAHLDIKEYKSLILNRKKLILFLFYIGLIAKYVSLFQTIRTYGLDNLKGNAYGIFAHIGSFATILLPFILIIYLQNKFKIQHILGFVLVLTNILIFGGKYIILITMVHIIVFYALINKVPTKKIVKYGFIIVLLSFSVFIINYVLRPIIETGYYNENMILDNLKFSFKHFFYYLLSPVIAMNDYFVNILDSSQGIPILFTVPINIFKAIFRLGNYVMPIYSETVPISYELGTNVAGLFSEAVHTGGWVIASLYVSSFFSFVYYFYLKMLNYSKNISLVSYLLGVVMFLFFCNFITVSGVFLNIIYLTFIEIILRKKFVIYK